MLNISGPLQKIVATIHSEALEKIKIEETKMTKLVYKCV